MDALCIAYPGYLVFSGTTTTIVVGKDSAGNISTTEQDSGAGGASSSEYSSEDLVRDIDGQLTYDAPDDFSDLTVSGNDLHSDDYTLYQGVISACADLMRLELHVFGLTITFYQVLLLSVLGSVVALVLRWRNGG